MNLAAPSPGAAGPVPPGSPAPLPVVAPAPAVAPPKPIVQPIAQPSARTPEARPQAAPAQRAQHKRHAAAPAHESAAPPAAHHTPETVQAKFLTVKREYQSFKTQYGGVLEDQWNAIANELTYGKANKFERVDAMLDSLRREMARVKSGG
jgi:hypothetical protein